MFICSFINAILSFDTSTFFFAHHGIPPAHVMVVVTHGTLVDVDSFICVDSINKTTRDAFLIAYGTQL